MSSTRKTSDYLYYCLLRSICREKPCTICIVRVPIAMGVIGNDICFSASDSRGSRTMTTVRNGNGTTIHLLTVYLIGDWKGLYLISVLCGPGAGHSASSPEPSVYSDDVCIWSTAWVDITCEPSSLAVHLDLAIFLWFLLGVPERRPVMSRFSRLSHQAAQSAFYDLVQN